ncbi:hypothetical protein [Agromyces cerinus]|uniref:Uncharacterized protein n=1 Tax=Agromyces cerinus subsp. cerinus TaxID=232089 RepID=A0A1N6DQB0_9MICO|nr:hypothetical protein [Agromyces cerinus]SIN72940.1 hypothetical protein SAMN05443544_0589 [Agromyces cerinus subsp. cerinus]
MPTPRGLPLYTTADPAKLDILLNGQSNAMDFAIGESEQDTRDGESAATVDDLPETGNWKGRGVFVEEDGTWRLCIGLPNTWINAYRVPVEGTISWQPGWSAEPGLSLERDADHVFLNFNAEKTSAVIGEETLGYLPAGFRPADKIYCSGSFHGTGDPGAAIISLEATGQMRVFFPGTTDQTNVAFCVAFPI